MALTGKPTFEEWLACTELDFEWGESYDSKDWTRLLAILAPTLSIDYAKVNNVFDDLSASAFITMMSNPKFLGNPLIDSQHLFGAGAKWVKESDNEISAHHQSRAAHVRWTDDTKKEVAARGHGHGSVLIKYRKVEGVWKWAGIKTFVRWNEHDWDKVFEDLDGKGHERK
ncbi:hypothetical protein G7Y89_g4158 [Cudoniella acicularis]|uniref:Scytalone dehydratase-like domain-containing protein n=1 Tax=Cudoniella acicularis TaxID=354080 RepID=A0A8H4RS51_9HELO|nr:hypothetical protein G7Y89_g4158 [Cudoniella acicularis]